MPTIALHNPCVPAACKGPLLVTAQGLPRYWPIIWADILHARMKPSTKKKHLYGIERLYRHAERLPAIRSLDEAIAEVDIATLEVVLTSFLTTLTNEVADGDVDNSQTWSSAWTFIRDLVTHIDAEAYKNLGAIHARETRLRRLYSQLRPPSRRPANKIRALPSVVVTDLYEIFSPYSPRNPYRTQGLKWRNFLVFLILLQLGIRRGELALLAADAIKSEFHIGTKRTRHWINIESNPYNDEDLRFDTPGIKTTYSNRQLPISEETLFSYEMVLNNFRKKPSHTYLFGSQKGKPISLRTINTIFMVASNHLSTEAKKALLDRGAYRVSPHDLRHTCAVYRLAQYVLHSNGNVDLAIDKLRVFFGWSHASSMPQHYARAYFECSQEAEWTESYDQFVSALRKVEGNSQC